MTTTDSTTTPARAPGTVPALVGVFIPPCEFPCLCCAHWDRAYRNDYCDACRDHARWEPQARCKAPTGETLCATCKHANKSSSLER
jgi:hypothetical protein